MKPLTRHLLPAATCALALFLLPAEQASGTTHATAAVQSPAPSMVLLLGAVGLCILFRQRRA